MPSRPALLRASSRRTAINAAVLAEALVALAAASLAIRVIPFRHVMRAAAWRGRGRPPADGEAAARRVRWAVRRWAAAVPWRAVCFQQGLAAQWMLRRRGLPAFLHYGIDPRAPAGISAHVWVTVHGRALLGGEEAGRHACVMIRPEPSAG